MTTSHDVDRLIAICPTFRFRAKHTLDVSEDELDEIIRSSAGRVFVDDIGQLVHASSADEDGARSSQPPEDDWRCLWTIPLDERR